MNYLKKAKLDIEKEIKNQIEVLMKSFKKEDITFVKNLKFSELEDKDNLNKIKKRFDDENYSLLISLYNYYNRLKEIENFIDSLQKNPNNIQLLYEISNFLIYSGDFDTILGVHFLDRILEIEPDAFGALQNKAYVLTNFFSDEEKIEEGLKVYDILIKTLKEDENLMIQTVSDKSRVLNKLERYEEVIEICDKISKLYPNDNDIFWLKWNSAMNLFIKQKKYSDALGICDVLLENYQKFGVSNDFYLKEIRGIIFFKMNNYIESIRHFDIVLNNKEEQSSVKLLKSIVYKGLSLFYLEKYSEVIEVLNKIMNWKDVYNYLSKSDLILYGISFYCKYLSYIKLNKFEDGFNVVTDFNNILININENILINIKKYFNNLNKKLNLSSPKIQNMIKESLNENGLDKPFSKQLIPKKPFNNKMAIRETIKKCKNYIYWVDKYFSIEGLNQLNLFVERETIKEIKIITSLSIVESGYRGLVKDLIKQFKEELIKFEIRIMPLNSKIFSENHDRYIITEKKLFNVVSPDIVKRGQYSHISEVEGFIPFDNWWKDCLDLIHDWNKIKKMKENLK